MTYNWYTEAGVPDWSAWKHWLDLMLRDGFWKIYLSMTSVGSFPQQMPSTSNQSRPYYEQESLTFMVAKWNERQQCSAVLWSPQTDSFSLLPAAYNFAKLQQSDLISLVNSNSLRERKHGLLGVSLQNTSHPHPSLSYQTLARKFSLLPTT